MIQLPTKLCACALVLVLGGFTGAGCIDNSGNKNYPRADASADGAPDVDEDAPAASDVATDAPAGDAPGGGDAAASDAATDHARSDAITVDALSADVHLDVLPGG
jgi:hypothetical protein